MKLSTSFLKTAVIAYFRSMKNFLFCIFFLFCVQISYSQIFEGKIVYSNNFKSKNPQVSDQQWDKMMGTEQIYFVKNGDYKSLTNGTMLQWQIYHSNDNRVYTKMSNSPAALWSDASVNIDEVLSSSINKNITTVLGYKCDELILTSKNGIHKYYFNTEIAASAKLYEKHKLGCWFDYLSRTNALPLKTILETDQFIMENEAIEIKALKLDSNTFEIPEGIKVEKNPY